MGLACGLQSGFPYGLVTALSLTRIDAGQSLTALPRPVCPSAPYVALAPALRWRCVRPVAMHSKGKPSLAFPRWDFRPWVKLMEHSCGLYNPSVSFGLAAKVWDYPPVTAGGNHLDAEEMPLLSDHAVNHVCHGAAQYDMRPLALHELKHRLTVARVGHWRRRGRSDGDARSGIRPDWLTGPTRVAQRPLRESR